MMPDDHDAHIIYSGNGDFRLHNLVEWAIAAHGMYESSWVLLVLIGMAWINWCFHKDVSLLQWLTSLTDTGFLILFLTSKRRKFTHAI